jgi:hypothetical protein
MWVIVLSAAAGAVLRQLLVRRRRVPQWDIAYHAELNAHGVILASSRLRLMTRSVVEPFCEDIQQLARSSDARGLVMDLDSLSRGTPSAGLYVARQLKNMYVTRIALVGGNPFMRRFAQTVLSRDRSAEFRFFEELEPAMTWAGGEQPNTA